MFDSFGQAYFEENILKVECYLEHRPFKAYSFGLGDP